MERNVQQKTSTKEQIKVNVPGSFQKASVDKVWGEGTRAEWEMNISLYFKYYFFFQIIF